ncbi:MAG: hypothetical protein NW703_16085 [Nitrospiraceae bacterium]
MLELLELIGGFFELRISWRFWTCFVLAGVVAIASSSSSEDSPTAVGLAVILMIVGVVVGWKWNKSRAGSSIP